MATNTRDWYFGFANGVDALKRELDSVIYTHRPKLLRLEHECSPAAAEAVRNFLAALDCVDYPTEFPDEFDEEDYDPFLVEEDPIELEF